MNTVKNKKLKCFDHIISTNNLSTATLQGFRLRQVEEEADKEKDGMTTSSCGEEDHSRRLIHWHSTGTFEASC